MNETKYFKAWVLFFAVATIVGMLVGAIAGGVAGFVWAIASGGGSGGVERYQFVFQLIGFLVSMPVSFYCYKWSISKYIVPQIEENISRATGSGSKVEVEQMRSVNYEQVPPPLD